MIHCKKCGNEVKENNKFCQKCGTPVETSQLKEEKPTRPRAQKAPAKPKKVIDEKTKKKRKIIAIVASIVLILGFASYKVGESLTSQDKVLEKFFDAVSEKDTLELANLLTSSDRRLELNEDNLKSFINFIDENPSYFEKMSTSLREQGVKINKPNINRDRDIMAMAGDDEEDDSQNNMIYLRKSGKKYLLYDNYEIVMQPFFVNISTNHSDVALYIDEQEIGTSTNDSFSKEFGPLVPGKYTVKGIYEGEYTTVEEEADINLMSNNMYSSNNNIVDQTLNFEMQYVAIDTNFSDADVIVNGTKIDAQASDFMDMGLGPVAGDTAVQLSKDFPWGTITTDELLVSDIDWYMSIYFNPINDKVQNDIMESINKFLVEDIDALNTRDVSKYTNIKDPILDSRTTSINNLIMWEELHKAELRSAIHDLNSLSIVGEPDYNATIRCRTNFGRAYYYESMLDPEYDLDLGDFTNNIEYYLSYDEVLDQWFVYNLYEQYYFDDSNTKEFNFDNQ